jgi:serine/threonine protein phosphatase PrpC
MEIKVLQLHKKASIEYKHIQDKYNFSTSNKCIALSDGTTQSFKSELWARMLVDNFVNNPLFDVNLLNEEFKSLATKFKNSDFEFSSNFAKASLEKAKKNKGGTATFIGLQFINDSTIKVLNCGDTCLFIVRNNEIISFPFKNIEELDNNNYFINSNKLLDNEVELEFFNFNEITILKDDKIVLATDAISRFIFRKPESISLILKCDNFEDLKKFCETNWENKELEEDDISIVIVSPISSNKIIEIIPPKDFSFPQIVEKEFIPTLKNQKFINNIDNSEMEQLNRMIDQLFKETHFLKNKLKLTQTLLISTIAILIINTLLLYFIYKKSSIVCAAETKNQVSTQFEVNEPLEDVEVLNPTTDELLNNKTNVKETTGEKETTKSKITNSKPENVISTPKSEDDKKNNIIKAETKKDSVK